MILDVTHSTTIGHISVISVYLPIYTLHVVCSNTYLILLCTYIWTGKTKLFEQIFQIIFSQEFLYLSV